MAKATKLGSKKSTVKIAFTDFWEPDMPGIISPQMIKTFLSQRFNLEISEKPDFLIYSKFGQDFQRFNCVRIFYTAENARPNFNECDFAFSFDYPITDKNYRLPLYKQCFLKP
ncbi:MAG: hypothetical protein AAGD96_34990, partial [Chloroflexota bacterium]